MSRIIIAALVVVVALAAQVLAADLATIEATALRAHLSESVILDARPKKEWAAGHLPGALPFPWQELAPKDPEGGVVLLREAAAALSRLGIDEKTPVVIYGDAGTSWGGEGWAAWVFSSLGHKAPVRVLNGGIQSWRGSAFPLVTTPAASPAKKAQYHVDPKPQLTVTTAELAGKRGQVSLVDVRSTMEWLVGRIPGAVHIPWQEFYSGPEKRPLQPAELKKLLARHGVDTGKPVVYYCAGGIRSSYAWLVHQLSGLPSARNYHGGMEAWRKRGN